jgi:hypothetical protein
VNRDDFSTRRTSRLVGIRTRPSALKTRADKLWEGGLRLVKPKQTLVSILSYLWSASPAWKLSQIDASEFCNTQVVMSRVYPYSFRESHQRRRAKSCCDVVDTLPRREWLPRISDKSMMAAIGAGDSILCRKSDSGAAQDLSLETEGKNLFRLS